MSEDFVTRWKAACVVLKQPHVVLKTTISRHVAISRGSPESLHGSDRSKLPVVAIISEELCEDAMEQKSWVNREERVIQAFANDLTSNAVLTLLEKCIRVAGEHARTTAQHRGAPCPECGPEATTGTPTLSAENALSPNDIRPTEIGRWQEMTCASCGHEWTATTIDALQAWWSVGAYEQEYQTSHS